MSIYILTTNSKNYGSILQKYVLYKYCKDNFNQDVFIVNINNKTNKVFKNTKQSTSLFNLYYMKICNRVNKQKHNNILNFEKNRFKFINYNDFIKKIHSKNKTCNIIVGSDQLWNPDSLNNVYTLDRMELKTDRNVKKISYAVSMPKEQLQEKELEYFRKILNNFDAISVREENTKKILSNVSDKDIKTCLDPTFLIDINDYSINYMEKDEKRKYLLMYMVRPMKKLMKLAKKIAKKENLKIINLGNTNVFDFKIKNANKAGIEDFLQLFKNATYIVTNSFHGTVFSILYQKKFLSLVLPHTGIRSKDLLEKLELTDRLISDSNEYEKIFNDIDYEKTNLKIKKYKEESRDFLKRELEV